MGEEEAEEVAGQLVGHPVEVTPLDKENISPVPEGIKAFIQPELFKKGLRRRTIFTAVPWFLMDIATYGVGIFTPTLIAAIAVSGADASFITDDIVSTEATALLDIFLPLGFLLAILFVDRLGRVKLQVIGFAGMTVALIVLALAEGLPGGGDKHIPMVAIGFALFNLLMNAGPQRDDLRPPGRGVSIRRPRGRSRLRGGLREAGRCARSLLLPDPARLDRIRGPAVRGCRLHPRGPGRHDRLQDRADGTFPRRSLGCRGLPAGPEDQPALTASPRSIGRVTA